MDSNRLKLNPSKTELVWFSTRQGFNKFTRAIVEVRSATIDPVKYAKSLGWRTQTVEARIECHKLVLLSDSTTETYPSLSWFSVGSRSGTLIRNQPLDYCNGLLAAAPAKQTDELQRVLNASARDLLRLPRYDFDLRAKVRDQLHWLRIPERVTYKLCTMVYKCLHGMALSYLNEMCIPVCSDAHRGHLRSADKKELKVPRHKQSTYGPRSFGIAGPSKWNDLPCHLRDENLSLDQFTSWLKTYLFRQSYNL